MKFQAFTVFSALIVATTAHDVHAIRRHHEHVARQLPSSATGAALAAPSSGQAGASAPAPTPSPGAPAPAAPQPQGTGALPLSEITSGMPVEPTFPVSQTYAPGATPSYSGAIPLPTTFVFVASEWPAPDKVAPTDSPEVQEWLKEIEGVEIPDIAPTIDGSCGESPDAAANAQQNGWWTCGGWTRPTDIVSCPDPLTWGVSFDDGPSPYTQTLLNYLSQKNLKSTFFVVGSRAVERPDVLVEEYMAGHEISVHTWAHPALTSLTNEQIVAELGWSRRAIQQVIGVTPTTFRPPYGDIDDRVRAIANAMGLTAIMWTATPSGAKFDTNDWRVAGGQETGEQQFQDFQAILGNATSLSTGFIVLEHDLFQVTVDLATQYTLNAALTHNPPFTLRPIGECNGIKPSDMYMETTTNQTYIAQRKKAASGANSTTTTNGTSGNGSSSNGNGSSSSTGNGSGAAATSGAVKFMGSSIATFGALSAALFISLL